MSEHLKQMPDGRVYYTKPNYLPEISFIWAFVSVDAHGEGVLAAPLLGPGSLVPLIAADEERLHSLPPIAEQIGRETGRTVHLVKFSTREVVRTITP